ncbi:hypothetical protein SE17_02860, partial [Kouleothrix aurantiaca]
MLKRHKDLLRPLVANLRVTLAGTAGADGTWQRGDLDRELERLGIAPDGTAIPIDALRNPGPSERRARVVADAYLAAAANGLKGAEAEQKRRAAREEFVERAAYTWINRLLALRTMEARGLIDETLRANPDYEGIPEALFVLRQTDPARCAQSDGGWWAVIDDACTAQAAFLPGLFDLSDPSAALRPSTAAMLRCVTLIGGAPAGFTLAEADAAFADPDAIGWTYQFYQEAAKARVYEKLGSGGKAGSRAEIAAATQLFTEPYMVKWLLQNSLGRSYHEIHPQSALPAEWDYYIRPTEDRPLNAPAPTAATLEMLTVLDPCVGSGHFLRGAFDLLAAMYREQHPDWVAQQVVETILRQHLHGIDIDPRAVQLAALTLYMRALEVIRDEARARRRPMPSWTPPQINLATTPSGLDASALERHLQRPPEDRPLRPVLERIFETLSQAEILGSLLRPAAEIDAAIAKVQAPRQNSMFDGSNSAESTALISHDPTELKRLVLDRIAAAFRAEAASADPADALFGREAERGVRLLQLLDRKYAVVVTNPPYMGSGNMPAVLKKYVEKHYKSGKRDLYAAFILRCLDLCLQGGHVAMVTQQSWMFLSSYAELRAVPDERLADVRRKREFTGLLRETSFQAVAHLGANAFEEVAGEVVQVALFIFRNSAASEAHSFLATRLIGLKSSNEKAQQLTERENRVFTLHKQRLFTQIPQSPIAYTLSDKALLLFENVSLKDAGEVLEGLHATDSNRFVKFFWETSNSERWFRYVKGGGYGKWHGYNHYHVDWEQEGARLKAIDAIIPSRQYYFVSGWTYSMIAQGSLGCRLLENAIFTNSGPGIFLCSFPVGALNSRVYSYLLRSINSKLSFDKGYVERLPILQIALNARILAQKVIDACCALKQTETRADATDRNFQSIQYQPQILS